MKLLRLKINEPFRSLRKGFEIRFNEPDKLEGFSPYCFVGRNGSGKSNVLEALGAIFYHLECIYLENRPDAFDFNEGTNPNGFKSNSSYPDAFELEYAVRSTWETLEMVTWNELENTKKYDKNTKWAEPLTYVKVVKEPEKDPVIHLYSPAGFEKDEKILMERRHAKTVLPELIVGYSSGENEIVSLPFFKSRFIQFDEYKHNSDRNNFTQPESRLLYVDEQYSQCILMALFLMEDHHEQIMRPFRETIKLKDIRTFRLIVRTDIELEVDEERKTEIKSEYDNERLQLKNEGRSDSEIPQPNYNQNLTAGIDFDTRSELSSPTQYSILNKLRRCATSWYEDEGSLYLDYWVNGATKAAFKSHFTDSFDLLSAFRVLITMNLYNVNPATKIELYQSDSLYVKETIPTPASDERLARVKDLTISKTDIPERNNSGKSSGYSYQYLSSLCLYHEQVGDKGNIVRESGIPGRIYLRNLSDGEHQFLHSIGICLLTRGKNALYLLDEPETHFNPDWRAKFISSLDECMAVPVSNAMPSDYGAMREVLITTHSPFIVSDCKRSNVFMFEKGALEPSKPRFETFGASVNFLTNEVFGKEDTISEMGKQAIRDISKRLSSARTPVQFKQLIDETLELGDSAEKMFLYEAIALKQKKLISPIKRQAKSKKSVTKKTTIKKTIKSNKNKPAKSKKTKKRR